MDSLIEQIGYCVEFGKVDKSSPYPPDMKDKDGAEELTKKALDDGINPQKILKEGLIPAMNRVGIKFKANEVFVPQVLMSAKAMKSAMGHLKPFFSEEDVKQKGTFIIGTVAGDLHDIGKNLVAIMIEGCGWNVVDLGTDVKTEQFVESVDQNPGAIVGMSALLTTTMGNMQKSVEAIKSQRPDTKIMVGGAPVNDEFCKEAGADFYSPDPQGAVDYLNALAS